MGQYTCKVIEVRSKTFDVDAETYEEAKKSADKAFCDGSVDLDKNPDYYEYEIEIESGPGWGL